MKIRSFFLPILKPYKWHLLIMIQAPIVHSFLLPLQALCFKMFIDYAGNGQFIDYLSVLTPIVFYILLNTFHSISWRVRDYAYTKSQPFIRGVIGIESYKRVQDYSYTFFQNTQSGSITSKIKGILHGYDDIINFITDNATKNLFGVLVSISMCFLIRAEVFIALLIWSAMFFTIMMMLYKKESKIAEVESTYKHKLLGMIADNITNIFTIFAFSKKDKESNKLKNFTESFTVQKDYEGNMMYTKVHCIGALLYLPMLFAALFYLIHLKIHNIITISDFIFILTNISIMLEAIYSFTFDIARFMRSFEDFKSSFSILQIKQEVIDKPDAKKLII